MAQIRILPTLAALALAVLTVVAIHAVLNIDYTGPEQRPTDYMHEFPPTDPALIRYREVDRIETGLKMARGIAVGPGHKIYVVGDDVLRIFDGMNHKDIKTKAPANCVAVAAGGTIYLGVEDHVEVYAPDGTREAVWSSAGTGAFLTSIAIADDGIYVADAANRVILRYDASGRIVQTIRKQDPERQINGVLMPSLQFDVAVRPGAADRLIRANDPGRLCVDVYTPDGELMASWGKPTIEMHGFGGCCNPTDIAVLPDGRVVTSEKGEARVKVYKANGEFDCVVAGPESFPRGWGPSADRTRGKALDLATDETGRIFVLDPSTSSIRIFVPKEADNQCRLYPGKT